MTGSTIAAGTGSVKRAGRRPRTGTGSGKGATPGAPAGYCTRWRIPKACTSATTRGCAAWPPGWSTRSTRPPSSTSPDDAWLRRLAARLVDDPAAADDLVQETWLATLRSPPDPDRAARPWLATVLRNASRQRGRGEGRRRHRERLVARAEDAVVDPARHVQDREMGELLRRSVERLPEAQRELLRGELDAACGGERRWIAGMAAFAARGGGALGPGPGAPSRARPAGVRRGKLAWGAGAGGLLVVAGAVGTWIATAPARGPDARARPDVVDATRARPTPPRLAVAECPAPLDAARAGEVRANAPDAPPRPDATSPPPPALALRVEDARTGRVLDGVTVLAHVPMGRHYEHPGSDVRREVVARAARSPIALDAPDALGETLFVCAPGYAWEKVELGAEPRGERLVALVPEARLIATFAGVDAGAGHGFTLFRPGGERPVLRRRVPDDGRALLVDGLRPGRYEAVVEERYALDPRARARAEVRLIEGRRETVALVLGERPEAVRPVVCSGTLELPLVVHDVDVRFDVRALDRERTEFPVSVRVDVRPSRIRHVPGTERRVAWSAGRLWPGRYQVRLSPFEVYGLVEVPAGGTTSASLVVPPLARVEVAVLEERTRRPVLLAELRYRRVPDADWYRPVSSDRAAPLVEGRFVLQVPPGLLSVAAGDPETTRALGLGRGRRTVDVRPGDQRVALALPPIVGLRLVLEDDGTRVPPRQFAGLRVEAAGHDGAVVHDGLAQDGVVECDAPGAYRVVFGDVSPYAPLRDRVVRLEAGALREVVVALRAPR